VKAFVCYSRAQFYLAEDLALALGQEGIDVWFDVHRLKPGDDWDDEIAEGLYWADCLVLVASPAALSSLHATAELELAFELEKPIVVGMAEDVALPGQLADAPRVSLGARFDDNAHLLSEHLKRPTRARRPAPMRRWQLTGQPSCGRSRCCCWPPRCCGRPPPRACWPWACRPAA
jgi:hypothetical protein